MLAVYALEAFCDSDPSTLTSCKHEFHLQCILEWCQRSSQCPMCWQSISLKDPSSQELLDAVEHERNIRMNPPRNTTIFHHSTLGDFELQHLPVNASESELEERIIQHLAAAAAMGRARQLARREGQRNRSSSSSSQGRPHFLVFSTHPNGASSVAQRDNADQPPTVTIAGPDSPFIAVGGDSEDVARLSSVQVDQLTTTASGSNAGPYQHGTSSNNRRSPAQTSPNSQDRAGPSDFQSFSESLKCRLSAMSTRYKESITKSTRGWKERLFARNSKMPEPNPQFRREVDTSPGFATVSQIMNNLEISEDDRTNISPNPTEGPIIVMGGSPSLNEDAARAPCS
ncbi:E3 ubiquitin-protein ligase rhf2a [Phtheirospermum japonicum]|uniref:RING-type E3 ubiquitin transferase n=1 Tax=Phtheirospermum japonicum TaxID=374723 RepID=A0A830CC36_9LAMI|nr:E3 ubiquitin-protein ligase rhf2a [Phtheirospermum japonicum]